MNEQRLIYHLNRGSDSLKNYLLTYCTKLIEEQRRLNIQFKLSKACNSFRGTYYINKTRLQEFQIEIFNIPFIETETVKEFKENLMLAINQYDNYYDEYGVRKIK